MELPDPRFSSSIPSTIFSFIVPANNTKPNNTIEVQAFPESNDVVGLKDLYVSLDISNSSINMVRDVISSGDEVSGVQFTRDFYSSSYPNGQIIRT